MGLGTLKTIGFGLEYCAHDVCPLKWERPRVARGVSNWLNRQWPEAESNRRHEDFQSSALPTELSGHQKEDAY